MRDDLHRTVPVSRAWRKVLKYASREADWGKFPAAIEAAVRGELVAIMNAKWFSGLESELKKSPTVDMFGLDQVSEIVGSFERRSTTATEFQLCETIRGIHAKDGDVPHLFAKAFSELCKHSTDAHIEQVGAITRQQFGPRVANDAMTRMRFLANNLAFEIGKHVPSRLTKKSDQALLSSTLEIQGVW